MEIVNNDKIIVKDILDKALQIGIMKGVETALKTMREMKQETLKTRYDRRLRNVRLLLENYKEFKAHCIDTKKIKSRENAIDILDDIESLEDNEVYVESIKTSKQRTKIILDHIDDMLDFYKDHCLFSPKKDKKRRYHIIHALYIADYEHTIEEIACELYVDRVTVYRDIKEAIKNLSSLFFGIDGINR
jgi:DNA invertase Pin-like site-specific DNA recombinase